MGIEDSGHGCDQAPQGGPRVVHRGFERTGTIEDHPGSHQSEGGRREDPEPVELCPQHADSRDQQQGWPASALVQPPARHRQQRHQDQGDGLRPLLNGSGRASQRQHEDRDADCGWLPVQRHHRQAGQQREHQHDVDHEQCSPARGAGQCVHPQFGEPLTGRPASGLDSQPRTRQPGDAMQMRDLPAELHVPETVEVPQRSSRMPQRHHAGASSDGVQRAVRRPVCGFREPLTRLGEVVLRISPPAGHGLQFGPFWPSWKHSSVWLKVSLTMPPRPNTTPTMTAAMAATSRPYSTADAPASRSRRSTRMIRAIMKIPSSTGVAAVHSGLGAPDGKTLAQRA